MSPVDAASVRRKLGHIVTTLGGLRPLARLSLEEYAARFYERKAAERLLQEAIEAALDVNAHLIAEHGHEVPEDWRRIPATSRRSRLTLPGRACSRR